jgi:pilus assembly protein CpaB
MMPLRTRSLALLLLALASGTAAAWLSLRYLRQEARPLLNPSASTGKAVVASKDLAVGTVVTDEDVRVVGWPGDAVPPGLITLPAEVVGRGVLAPMRLNEPFMEAKLAPRGSGGGMPVLITEGMRALSVRVDEVVGVAGFVVPGTRVDVLLTLTSGPASEPTTKAILQNLEALAAGQSIQVDAAGKPQQVPVVTLLVTPEQAETLTLAANQGQIQMALRNQLDTLPIRTNGARVSALLGPARAAQPPQVLGLRRSTVTPRAAPATEETIVEGFRGGERTLTRFTRPTPPQPNPPEER